MKRQIDYKALHKKASQSTVTTDESGRFSGYASVWGVVDDQGDIVHRGAFAESIQRYEQDGRKFPGRYLHGNPVGYLDVIREDEKGLWVEGVILHEASALAAEAYVFVKAGAVAEMSVGFYYIDGGTAYDYDAEVWNVYKVDLKEVSLVDIGSNAETRIETIKSAGQENELAELEKVDAILSGIVANQQQQALDKIAELFK